MTVLTHVTIGTNNLDRARDFYDKVLGKIGVSRLGEKPGQAYFYGVDAPVFAVYDPINGEPATFANGGTVGFAAPSRAAVRAFHEEALANGGKCDGPPGLRPFMPTAYGAYIRDHDGNKLCAYCYADGE